MLFGVDAAHASSHMLDAGHQVDAELLEEMDHVDEHPVFGELPVLVAPEIDAVDARALA